MPIFGSDQLRCSLVQNNSKPNLINYVMSRADGTILDEIEIGQEDWPHSYPKDKKFFKSRMCLGKYRNRYNRKKIYTIKTHGKKK